MQKHKEQFALLVVGGIETVEHGRSIFSRSLPSESDASLRRAVLLRRIFRGQPQEILSCSAAAR